MRIAPQGGQMHFRGQLAGYSHLRYLTNKPLNRQTLRTFDRWLKGVDTGIMREPQVVIFDNGTRR